MSEQEILQLGDNELIEMIKHSNDYSMDEMSVATKLVQEKELLSAEEIETFLTAQELEKGDGEQRYEIDEEKLQRYMANLKSEENFALAISGGLAAALVSAAIWAIVTYSTGYQIGYMAIGVGFLVGLAVRFLGKGISQKFGFWGGICSVLGCLFGNVFAMLGFFAHDTGESFMSILTQMDWTALPSLIAATFDPMDALFYGFAIYFGYQFSFRQIDEEEIIQEAGKLVQQ